MTQNLQVLLPALSGSAVTYDAAKNLYLTDRYTSQSGNSYYKAIKDSDRLTVCCDIGEGYSKSFINGVTMYANDGTRKVMIGSRTYGGHDNWVWYTDRNVLCICFDILRSYFNSQLKALGKTCSEKEVNDLTIQCLSNFPVLNK